MRWKNEISMFLTGQCRAVASGNESYLDMLIDGAGCNDKQYARRTIREKGWTISVGVRNRELSGFMGVDKALATTDLSGTLRMAWGKRILW
jgi:hypothetical protein